MAETHGLGAGDFIPSSRILQHLRRAVCVMRGNGAALTEERRISFSTKTRSKVLRETQPIDLRLTINYDFGG
jgi:hypothetical protein